MGRGSNINFRPLGQHALPKFKVHLGNGTNRTCNLEINGVKEKYRKVDPKEDRKRAGKGLHKSTVKDSTERKSGNKSK